MNHQGAISAVVRYQDLYVVVFVSINTTYRARNIKPTKTTQIKQ